MLHNKEVNIVISAAYDNKVVSAAYDLQVLKVFLYFFTLCTTNRANFIQFCKSRGIVRENFSYGGDLQKMSQLFNLAIGFMDCC